MRDRLFRRQPRKEKKRGAGKGGLEILLPFNLPVFFNPNSHELRRVSCVVEYVRESMSDYQSFEGSRANGGDEANRFFATLPTSAFISFSYINN